jgi:pilus assembly protein CpaF
MAGGDRKIMQISEVTGLHGEAINMHDLFVYQQTGVSEGGKAVGAFEACGIVPNCMATFESHGVQLARSVFERGASQAFDRLNCLRGI